MIGYSVGPGRWHYRAGPVGIVGFGRHALGLN